MNEDDLRGAVVAVALGVVALCVEVGSATAYDASMNKDVSGFITAHPFDVLSVAVWYSAGNWLARHTQQRYWWASFAPLVLSAAAALALGQIIIWRGLSQGPLGAALDRLRPKALAGRDAGLAQA